LLASSAFRDRLKQELSFVSTRSDEISRQSNTAPARQHTLKRIQVGAKKHDSFARTCPTTQRPTPAQAAFFPLKYVRQAYLGADCGIALRIHELCHVTGVIGQRSKRMMDARIDGRQGGQDVLPQAGA
jgi:hypothetical protein